MCYWKLELIVWPDGMLFHPEDIKECNINPQYWYIDKYGKERPMEYLNHCIIRLQQYHRYVKQEYSYPAKIKWARAISPEGKVHQLL